MAMAAKATYGLRQVGENIVSEEPEDGDEVQRSTETRTYLDHPESRRLLLPSFWPITSSVTSDSDPNQDPFFLVFTSGLPFPGTGSGYSDDNCLSLSLDLFCRRRSPSSSISEIERGEVKEEDDAGYDPVREAVIPVWSMDDFFVRRRSSIESLRARTVDSRGLRVVALDFDSDTDEQIVAVGMDSDDNDEHIVAWAWILMTTMSNAVSQMIQVFVG
ncbi:hypothetical protein Cni_G10436 [Canna indica]|uniref:Uncharacterized protein n=1 Tax=Canna indica TaxID=4628 RepID=A0AAQ3K428_9LILI|nr:hypothetical protein Cni_G10436 [Canna indica]